MSYLGDTKLDKTWTPGKEYVISAFCEFLVLLNALAFHRCCLFSFLLILLFLTQPPPPNTHTHRHTHITNSQSPRNTGLFVNGQPLQTVLFKISIPFLMPGQIHLSPQDSAEVFISSFQPTSTAPDWRQFCPSVQLQCPVHTSPFILKCYEIIYFLLTCLTGPWCLAGKDHICKHLNLA